MNEQLRSLIRLQEIHTQLDQLQINTNRLPEAIDQAEKSVLQSRKENEKAQGRYESMIRDRKQKEIDLAEQEERQVKLQRRVTEVKTNKEYQALQEETAISNKTKGDLEEAILILMDQVDQVHQEAERRQKAAAEAERHFESEKLRVEKELAENQIKIRQVEQETNEVEERLEKGILEDYRKLRVLRNGLGVVPVKEGTCLGCSLALPPQVFADVKKNESILSCSYCRRFLYWPHPTLSSSSMT